MIVPVLRYFGGFNGGGGIDDDKNLYRLNITSNTNLASLTAWEVVTPVGATYLYPRFSGATWVDDTGRLWVHGGGNGTEDTFECQRDLWVFTPGPNTWAMIRPPGRNATDRLSFVAGLSGVESPAYYPPGSCGAATRFANGIAWMYGGRFPDSWSDDWNDLWRFNVSSGNWAWVSGSLGGFQQPFWVKSGYFSPSYHPGSGAHRPWLGYLPGMNWIWLWGGISNAGRPGEVWTYSITDGQWAISPGTVGHEVHPNFYGPPYATPGHLESPAIFQHPTSGDVIVFGGFRAVPIQGYVSTIWKLSMQEEALPPSPGLAVLEPPAHPSQGGLSLKAWNVTGLSLAAAFPTTPTYQTSESGVLAWRFYSDRALPGITTDRWTVSFKGYIWNFDTNPGGKPVRFTVRCRSKCWLATGADQLNTILLPTWKAQGSNFNFTYTPGSFDPDQMNYNGYFTLPPGPTPFHFLLEPRSLGGEAVSHLYIADADGSNQRLMHDSFVSRSPYDPQPYSPATQPTIPNGASGSVVAQYFWNRTDSSGSPEVWRLEPRPEADFSTLNKNPFGIGYRSDVSSVKWTGWLYAVNAIDQNSTVDFDCADDVAADVNGTNFHARPGVNARMMTTLPLTLSLGWNVVNITYIDRGTGGGCSVTAKNSLTTVFAWYPAPIYVAPPVAPPPILPPSDPPVMAPVASPQVSPQAVAPVATPAAIPAAPPVAPPTGGVGAPSTSTPSSPIPISTTPFASEPLAAPASIPAAATPPADLTAANGFKGEYFSNPTLVGEPSLRRIDSQLSFSWAAGAFPVQGSSISARWTAYIDAKALVGENGNPNVALILVHTGGARLFLNNGNGDVPVLDRWSGNAKRAASEARSNALLSFTNPNIVRIEFHSGVDPNQSIKFQWASSTAGAPAQDVPTSAVYPNGTPPTGTGQSSSINVGGTVGGSLGALAFVVIVVLVVLFVLRKKGRGLFKKKSKTSKNEPAEKAKDPKSQVWDDEEGATEMLPPKYSPVTDLSEFKEEWMIPWEDITLGKKLGQGAFGIVYRGEWAGSPVAIKQCTLNVAAEGIQAFKDEAKLMLYV